MTRLNIRRNWRIILLVVFLLSSTVALFAPLGQGNSVPGEQNTSSTVSGQTNLKFGLDLSGGTRIRAPLVGLTAEDVQLEPNDSGNLEQAVSSNLGLTRHDVAVRYTSQTSGTVEVFDGNVSKQRFANVLQSQGKDVTTEGIREGVTRDTMETARKVLDRKISGAGLSGGEVAIVTSATGENSYIVVEVPGQTPQQVIDLVNERGSVQLVAHFPVDNNGTKEYWDVAMFSQDGMRPQAVRQQDGQPVVPISLTDEAAENFSKTLIENGFTSAEGIGNCRYPAQKNDSGYCIYTLTNGKVINGSITEGEIVYGAPLGGDLAAEIDSGNFLNDPQFVIEAPNMSTAQRLRMNLEAGSLPTKLDTEGGTTSFIQPTLAERFKLYSLVTGLLAMIAVGGVVSYRYREPQVALPMIGTAAAEVFILLGFSAAIGLAIDLSHIAGFIAVVGTGVDDLVILADEILQREDISTDRVFRSRFKKAFWVIGAAAATTIVAMSPLAVLSLGDVQGFALVTIVGVLIGVLITRPAYGDILQKLVTK